MRLMAILMVCSWFSILWAQPDAPLYHSPTAIVANAGESRIFVMDETAAEISELDTQVRKVVRTISLAGRPTGAALTKVTNRLYVTLDTPNNSVSVVDLNTGKAQL